MPTQAEIESLESLLHKLPPEDQAEAFRILYGNMPQSLPIHSTAQALADEFDFDVAAYRFTAAPEQRRPPRIVRVGVIQTQIVEPTHAPLERQFQAICKRTEQLIHAAGTMGCNVLGLQEAWTMPFAFCTREKHPWLEFAEPVDGPSTQFLASLARQYNMVIVSPILERDDAHGGTIHNTVVVIGNRGNIIGKHRKNHIPRVGDFNESTYYMEGDTGWPVFETQFGKVGINICYGRHHPLNWLMFGINGAEIVFNPSATVGALSEPLWPIEARCASIATEYPLEVKVVVDPMPQVLSLWGDLTDNIYQITVEDEQTRGIVRSFWVKPGLGIVRLYDRTLGSNSFDLWLGNNELFDLPASSSDDSTSDDSDESSNTEESSDDSK